MGLIYKREQGLWVRVVTLVVLVLVGLWGAYDLYTTPLAPGGRWVPPVLAVAAFAAGVFGAGYLNLVPKAADLLIETEGELKKVAWPKWPEVVSATGVVILVVAVMSGFIFGMDSLIYYFFQVLKALIGHLTAT